MKNEEYAWTPAGSAPLSAQAWLPDESPKAVVAYLLDWMDSHGRAG